MARLRVMLWFAFLPRAPTLRDAASLRRRRCRRRRRRVETADCHLSAATRFFPLELLDPSPYF